MGGRIFLGFLIIITVSILFMIPVSEAVYDYRTDLRTDAFTVVTAPAATTGNVTLIKPVYDDDTSTISFSSNDTNDSPLYSNYDTATRELEVSGLEADTTRLLSLEYDVDALNGSDAINTLMDYISWIWFILLVGFPAAALAAIFMGRS